MSVSSATMSSDKRVLPGWAVQDDFEDGSDDEFTPEELRYHSVLRFFALNASVVLTPVWLHQLGAGVAHPRAILESVGSLSSTSRTCLKRAPSWPTKQDQHRYKLSTQAVIHVFLLLPADFYAPRAGWYQVLKQHHAACLQGTRDPAQQNTDTLAGDLSSSTLYSVPSGQGVEDFVSQAPVRRRLFQPEPASVSEKV